MYDCVQFLKPRRRQMQVSVQIHTMWDMKAQSIFHAQSIFLCIIEMFILGPRKRGIAAEIVGTLDTIQALPLY
jgi:hypothetical protein